MKKIYLDYAAATPLDPQVLKAMERIYKQNFYNPSATYMSGRITKQVLNDARAGIANLLGAKPGEIFFTAGATEANNLAISGVMLLHSRAEILVSAIEHESVLAPARQYRCREIPATKQGLVDISKLRSMISDDTVLVSVMLVNNELGTIQPIRDIAKLIREVTIKRRLAKVKTPIYLHTDAAQAGNYLDLHTARLGVDLMSLNGGKVYGPKQSGVLFVRAGIHLEPLIKGGGQEFGLRSGTENTAAAVGLAKSLVLAQNKRAEEANRIRQLRDYLRDEIINRFPNTIINSSAKNLAPHILSISLPSIDNEKLMFQLDEAGIMVAVGSACSASSDEPSHVLSAIGLSSELARSTIRFSLGSNTKKSDLKKVIKVLLRLVDSYQ